MSANVVQFPRLQKAVHQESQVRERKASELTGKEIHQIRRKKQVDKLVALAKQSGNFIIGAGGHRFVVDENSVYGFKVSDNWKALAPARAGSVEWLRSRGEKVDFAVTAHYPLIAATAYYSYTLSNNMIYSRAFIYQGDELTPTYSFTSWFEDLSDAININNQIGETVLAQIVVEQKRRFKMDFIDFEETKHIHNRIYTKR